jgi:hypothetical protein
MALLEIVQKLGGPQIIEGTPDEIAIRLKTVKGEKRLTLIIPGDEIAATTTPKGTRTLRQIFAESQHGFDESGLTDDQLSDLLESEVKAYRAERRSAESPDS